MHRPHGPDHPWWLPDRLGGLLGGRYRRFVALVGLVYCSAVAGLAVTFLEGTTSPTSDLSAVGIALLAVCFLCLFYLSVTLLSVEE